MMGPGTCHTNMHTNTPTGHGWTQRGRRGYRTSTPQLFLPVLAESKSTFKLDVELIISPRTPGYEDVTASKYVV